ncbi:beta-N-acetylhexosaminidase [Pseudoruegeria sp. SHC-113]|uniref:beta-N-acetylhexosaminidase n=1 Tax=Pseudoruegeria sp. SHC-113 TaxID=2855439 RepID=UPI0021BB3A42|nr:beta-N-acetylhexosaminidase [Pseudoruegeria sp. SHC-113]MCT8161931.1 beta-N-acetylhexosaminidase [Pseudoruegeria sp. SHC-113]
MTLTLIPKWRAGAGNGRLDLDLGTNALPEGTRLCLTSQLYPLSGDDIRGGTLTVADGSYLEVTLDPGATCVSVGDLFFIPRHAGEGPASAWLALPDGTVQPLTCQPMRRDPELGVAPLPKPEPQAFDGPRCTPWPNGMQLAGLQARPKVNLSAAGAALDRLNWVLKTIGKDAGPLNEADGLPLLPRLDEALPPEAYRLEIGAEAITLSHGKDGLFPALITLAQMLEGCGHGFGFPATGSVIEDAPAYPWRGMHLDCARHFFAVEDVERLLAHMAWLKLNRFHWHLTDDEAWRPEIRSLPQLTGIGAQRGFGLPLTAQLGDGPDGHSGHYSTADMARVVATAAGLRIEVMPEIDLPGHNTALLRAMPELVDAQEAPRSYSSVQNFANNSLNPAMPGAVETVETILADLLAIFPAAEIHLGGDELPSAAWATSPVAQAAAGEAPVLDLQKSFFPHLQGKLAQQGRRIALWDEQGRVQSAAPEGALIFCWQDVEVASLLAERGYRLVLCPAQATYLDIAESPHWEAAGSGWAGHASLADSYAFAPESAVPAHHLRLIEGVQACLWTEQVRSWADLEALTFPRLAAVAETGWTQAAHKDFTRFMALQA